ncbi:hypothetical protein SAMN05443287_105406 [Micromonospora phaseoli]|uniref:Uncharacterized protein n=1 Tax=Micromonospora phaseoli TaxID=1144548 RepID=A0A1H7AEB6_9ACTN|nr:hypothetical protein [Micromonospora phaseoli]PZV96902.1 hypothetical protein CLV64_1067 [Micromonospora phaseoli]GIJ77878.1 hypothetical protein Xph01_23100 [Micromonospora phaseoli]SEJ59355.1 hypothetical protein SAMN05443287_105406 [Micromonospora phaseoli]
MTWARLHLRARRVPLALAVAAATIALVWVPWRAFAEPGSSNLRLANLTMMLAVVAFSATLSGADDAIERTASLNWPVHRAGLLLLAAIAIIGMLLLTTVTDARIAEPGLILRNTAGLLGLTALGAALLGAARSWIAPLTWALITTLPVVEPSTAVGTQVAGWLIQPTSSSVATVFAAGLAVAGTLAYCRYGCPRRLLTETAPDH